MVEITGNIWTFHRTGAWVAITTNGVVKPDGSAVMGRGVALQARRRFPRLPYELGAQIRAEGNQVFAFPQYRLYTLPVKGHWRDRADQDLIVASCRQLAAMSRRTRRCIWSGLGAGQVGWLGRT